MKIKKAYSIALYEIFKEQKNKNEFYKDIQSLHLSFEQHPTILKILSSKMLSKNERKKIIDKIFDDKINKNIRFFLYILIDNEYFVNIVHILKMTLKKIDILTKQIFVKIETAYELDDNNIKKILNAIKNKWNKKIDYTIILNKNLIGGIKITIDDKEIDGSIQGKLKNIKKGINFQDRKK